MFISKETEIMFDIKNMIQKDNLKYSKQMKLGYSKYFYIKIIGNLYLSISILHYKYDHYN